MPKTTTRGKWTDLGWQDSHTAVQWRDIIVPALAEGGWGGVAADIALLSLHDPHLRIQADDIPVTFQVSLGPHKQQPAQDSCQWQVGA